MSALVSWGYYSSLHSKVTEEEFNKAEELAEKELKLVISAIRFEMLDTDGWYMGQVKDCICNTIDLMADINKSGSGIGVGSISNDGYTESYSIQTPSQMESELQSNIRAWLSGTGLAGAY